VRACGDPPHPPVAERRGPPSRKRAERGKCGLSGRFALHEAVTPRRAVGRKAVLGERLLDAVIEHADFADAPCVAAARDLATEFA
jgi:hypothetical protein